MALCRLDKPFSRRQFQPGHFTASGFVLSVDGDQVLMILHSKLGRWLQPGGHVDSGDVDVLDAARREVAEETGLVRPEVMVGSPILLDVDVHRIPANPRRDEPAHEHFDLRVLFRARSMDVRAGSDAVDARWVRLDAVQNLETDESVLRAVRKIRSIGAG